MANKKHGIIVAGDALIDYQYFVEALPKAGGDEKIISTNISLGGAAANTALALGKLGAQVSILGCMGTDNNAKLLTEELRRADVDTFLIQHGGKTGYTVDLVDKTGERTMLSFRGASARAIELTQAVRNRLMDSSIFLISGYLLTDPAQTEFVMQAAQLIKEHGGLVALDPCPVVEKVSASTIRALLKLTDILLPNARELDIIQTYEKANSTKDALTPACMAVKQGSKGALLSIKKGFVPPGKTAFGHDMIIPVAIEKLGALDTTGAGDAFNAGFLASMLKGDDSRAWVENANKMAGKCILQYGAVSAQTKEQL